MNNGFEHVFKCLLAIWIASFVISLFMVLYFLFFELAVLFLFMYWPSLCIINMTPMLLINFITISLILWCTAHFLTISYWWTEALNLMYSNELFIFCLEVCVNSLKVFSYIKFMKEFSHVFIEKIYFLLLLFTFLSTVELNLIFYATNGGKYSFFPI